MPLKNPECMGELPLITVKSCFLTDWKTKEIVRENCNFVREMSGNFEWTQMWQPCRSSIERSRLGSFPLWLVFKSSSATDYNIVLFHQMYFHWTVHVFNLIRYEGPVVALTNPSCSSKELGRSCAFVLLKTLRFSRFFSMSRRNLQWKNSSRSFFTTVKTQSRDSRWVLTV